MRNLLKGYKRTIFNLIVNTPTKVARKANFKREFLSIDMFPTHLASIGVKIPSERLGLGTNLFSGVKTLAEKMGVNKVNNLLRKPSYFFWNMFEDPSTELNSIKVKMVEGKWE